MLSLFQNAAVTKKELKGAPNVNMIPQANADVKNLPKVQNVENATMAITDLELIHSQLVKVQLICPRSKMWRMQRWLFLERLREISYFLRRKNL